MIIREKVELKPSAATPLSSPAKSAAQLDYFWPPAFITYGDQPVLTLNSSVTVSGQITIAGPINANQHVVIAVVLSPYNEQSVAWAGREALGFGGNYYSGGAAYTGVFGKGGRPNVMMYVFDWQWADVYPQISTSPGELSMTFRSFLRQGLTSPSVNVSGTATAAASILPNALFHHWEVQTDLNTLTCGQKSGIAFFPLDGSNQWYEPYGLSKSDAYVSVSVEAKGDYAYLRCGEREGKEITISLAEWNPVELWLDTRRGGIPGERDTAIVRVTGGGKTGEVRVALFCEKLDHLRIAATPQTLLIGGTSTLRVTAEDVNNQEVVPESDFDVMFTLSSPDIYWGSVRDTTKPDGGLPALPGIPLKKSAGAREGANRTLSRLQSSMFGSFAVDGGALEPDQITVPYSVAKEGKVKYVADGDMLSWLDPITVNIRVEKAADPSKFGSADVTVRSSSPPVIDMVRTSTGDDFFAVGAQVTLEAYYHDDDDDVISAEWLEVPTSPTAASTKYASQRAVARSLSSSVKTKTVTLQNVGENKFTFTVKDAVHSEVSEDLVIEGLSPCVDVVTTVDISEPTFISNAEAGNDCLGRLGFTGMDGRPGHYEPCKYVYACLSAERDRWELRIPRVEVGIIYSVCNDWALANGYVSIDNAYHPAISNDTYCKIIAEWEVRKTSTGTPGSNIWSPRATEVHEREGHGPQIQRYIRKAIEGSGGFIGLVNSANLLKSLARTPEKAREKMKRYYEAFCRKSLPDFVNSQMARNKRDDEREALKAAGRIFDEQIQEIKAGAEKEGWKPCEE